MKKKLLLIPIFALLFLANCRTSIDMIKDPENNSQAGIVAFGLFLYDDEASALFSNDSIKVTSSLPSMLYLQETSENKKTHINLDNKNKQFFKDSDKHKYYYADNLVLGKGINAYYATVMLDPSKQYRFSSAGYLITTVIYLGNGTRTYRTTPVYIPIVEDSSPVFTSSPGKIKYLGLFAINNKIIKKGTAGILRIGEKKAGFVEDGVPILKNLTSSKPREHFFGESTQDEEGSEIQFLKLFIQRQQPGYWQNKAIERLKELGQSYNGT